MQETRFKLYPIKQKLAELGPCLAKAAQEVYDDWYQIPGGHTGGICDDIAEAMAHELLMENVQATSASSNQEVHTFVIAAFTEGVFIVDIPYSLYEIGSYYTWKKIPNVVFTPDFLTSHLLDPDPTKFEGYMDT